jgi:hypothetical protein
MSENKKKIFLETAWSGWWRSSDRRCVFCTIIF